MQDYIAAVEGRIKALSRAHVLLSQVALAGRRPRKLVERSWRPIDWSDACRVAARAGRSLLEPATAQTLALALHELATNAAKYGALFAASGQLR